MGTQVHDADRLAAVDRSGLVDSDREAVYDELTRAAAELLGAPFAFMTAVDDQRSFWKSTYGIEDDTRFNSVGDSFCQYVIERRDDLIVGDATADEVTKDNPSIDSMGVMAWAGCPVEVDGHILGTFCVVDQKVREWTDRDREILHNLSAVAASEIAARTRLRTAVAARSEAESEAERLRDLLETLRVSLLPPTLPEIAGVDLAAWFEAASDGDLLLGDFYDVFPLGAGRWGAVIGDVCGHGAEAARLTSLVRYALRGAAVQLDDPTDVLAVVDRAVRDDPTERGRFATLCYFVIDAGSGPDALSVRYCRAGHPPPILVTARGRVPLDEASGPPIGLPSNVETPWVAGSFDLGRGECVVAFTDGATDCRDPGSGVRLGEDGLDALVGESGAGGAPVADLVERVADGLRGYSEQRTDDIVVLAFGPRA